MLGRCVCCVPMYKASQKNEFNKCKNHKVRCRDDTVHGVIPTSYLIMIFTLVLYIMCSTL